MSDEGGGNEAHSFDGVFGDVVFDILAERWATLDDETSSTDTGDFDAELFKKETDVLNHVVR